MKNIYKRKSIISQMLILIFLATQASIAGASFNTLRPLAFDRGGFSSLRPMATDLMATTEEQYVKSIISQALDDVMATLPLSYSPSLDNIFRIVIQEGLFEHWVKMHNAGIEIEQDIKELVANAIEPSDTEEGFEEHLRGQTDSVLKFYAVIEHIYKAEFAKALEETEQQKPTLKDNPQTQHLHRRLLALEKILTEHRDRLIRQGISQDDLDKENAPDAITYLLSHKILRKKGSIYVFDENIGKAWEVLAARSTQPVKKDTIDSTTESFRRILQATQKRLDTNELELIMKDPVFLEAIKGIGLTPADIWKAAGIELPVEKERLKTMLELSESRPLSELLTINNFKIQKPKTELWNYFVTLRSTSLNKEEQKSILDDLSDFLGKIGSLGIAKTAGVVSYYQTREVKTIAGVPTLYFTIPTGKRDEEGIKGDIKKFLFEPKSVIELEKPTDKLKTIERARAQIISAA